MSSDESQRELGLEKGTVGSGKETSVAEMAPTYPRHRDYFIKGFAVLLLILLVGGGYLLMKGTESALVGLKENPVEFVSRLIWGEGIFDTCQAFVRENEGLFAHLGKQIDLSLITQEVRVVNRAKTAKVVARAQGETKRETVFFFLERRKGKWHVASAAARTLKGEYRTIYPRSDPASNNI